MKHFYISFNVLCTICLLGLLGLTSCNDDNDDGSTGHSFLDQNMSGMIDGISFNFKAGSADIEMEENTMDLDFFDVNEENDGSDDFCGFFGFGENVKVFFFIKNEVGLYNLELNTDLTGQTVTLFNPDGAQNFISADGAVEILSISETEVKGRIDAKFDKENFVNGNFTLSVCNVQ